MLFLTILHNLASSVSENGVGLGKNLSLMVNAGPCLDGGIFPL